MDRRQQTHVDQVSRDFANLQQNGAFDAQAGSYSPQYVQDTQHMYTPHPLDRNAQGDSRSLQALNRQRDQRCIRLQITMPRPAWQTTSRWYLWRISLRCFRLMVLLARTYTVQRGTDVWPSNGDPQSKAGCCVFTLRGYLPRINVTLARAESISHITVHWSFQC